MPLMPLMPEYPDTQESYTINIDAPKKEGQHVPMLYRKRKQACFMEEELTVFRSMTHAVKEVVIAIMESKMVNIHLEIYGTVMDQIGFSPEALMVALNHLLDNKAECVGFVAMGEAHGVLTEDMSGAATEEMAGCGEAKTSSVSMDEEASMERKFGGIAPKKPLISKDHERAYFDSADWVLGKQSANSSSSAAVESLKPKLKVSTTVERYCQSGLEKNETDASFSACFVSSENSSPPAPPSQAHLCVWLRHKGSHCSSR
ncbi:Histone-lysine N-methyltransferase SUVR5 [Hordeum vulgare]|nr:Histone-lysine N-methyltransferase SUVR5 [Hordeum vulgare]